MDLVEQFQAELPDHALKLGLIFVPAFHLHHAAVVLQQPFHAGKHFLLVAFHVDLHEDGFAFEIHDFDCFPFMICDEIGRTFSCLSDTRLGKSGMVVRPIIHSLVITPIETVNPPILKHELTCYPSRAYKGEFVPSRARIN